MKSRLQMFGRAIFIFLLAIASAMPATAASGYQGGKPWQIGDIVVCFGNGTCNVLRIVGGAPVLLDQISDGQLGQTFGVAINNTLHVLVTDNAASHSGSTSNAFEYTIASIDPLPNPGTVIAHTPISTAPFNDGGANAQAVVVNAAGQIFVGNAGSGATLPSIAKFDALGNLLSVLTLPAGCTDSPVPSFLAMDLSADGTALYLTSGGPTIQKLTLSTGTCAPFADFGGNTKLYGIKDIPPGALGGVAPNCKGTACPTDEAILVVAIGNTDPDAGEPGEPTQGGVDTDAVNVCTNTAGGSPVSCALLLDTSASDPGLTNPLWHSNNQYFTLGTPILDPSLHLQTVYTAGTSGADEPKVFNESGGTTIDNAVQWTDIVQPTWTPNNAYAKGALPAPTVAAVTGTFFVDPHGNLQTVTTAGTSGPTEPGVAPNPVSWAITGGTTIDGLQWQDQGAWLANHLFTTVGGSPVGDLQGHVHEVLTPGTSGGSTPIWNDTNGTNGGLTAAGVTIDNAVEWTDIVQPAWLANHSYPKGSLPAPGVAAVSGTFFVDPNGNLETVSTSGISSSAEPGTAGNPVSWNMSAGGLTVDGLQWQDQGAWQPSVLYSNVGGSPVGDVAGHIHEVLTAGTSGASLPSWNDSGGATVDNAVTWTNQGPVVSYSTNHPYALGTYTSPNGHIQQVVEPGTSGGSVPAFSTSGTRTIDNAVTWSDLGQAVWRPNFSYGLNAIVVDAGGHVQQVSTPGTSGPTTPSFPDGGGTFADGLQWQNTGTVCGSSCLSPWAPGTQYAAGSVIDDATGFEWNAISGGTSGTSAPPFESNETPDTILADNAVVWTDQGLQSSTVFNWQANNAYIIDAEIVDPGNHVQVVSIAGISGPAIPTFVDGGTVMDNAVTWADLGQAVWRPSFSYGLNAIIVDAGHHVQQVTTAGTTGAGPTPPSFPDDGTSSTTDGSVVWTDRGLLAGSAFTWQASNPYSQNAMIVDTTGDVQLATNAGQSGAGTPTFVDGANVVDGLVWMDMGPVTTWTASTSFALGTLTVDPGSFLQKVTTAGVSTTPSQPTWNDAANGMTVDGLQWTDQGASVWVKNTLYPIGMLISDAATHVQKVYEAGTSGPGPNPPAFNEMGGMTIDNAAIWTESHPVRVASRAYVANAIVLDTFSPVPHIQQATAGITGTAAVFAFSDTGKTTIDGLEWSDLGHLVWTPGTLHAIGDLISDPATHAQQVYEAGTTGTTAPTFNDAGGMIVDNAVIWTVSNPMRAPSTAYVSGAIVVDTFSQPQVQQATLAGITGPGAPFAFNDSGKSAIDGLQWINQASPATSVVARYPVNGNTTIQSLSLDPLIADCTGGCSTLPLPGLQISNFWLGDNGSANFYKLDFATGAGGTPTALNAAPSCPPSPPGPSCANYVNLAGSGIQGLSIYGAEGSNQPGLTKLLTNYSLASGNSFTANVHFPLPFNASVSNSWTVTAYGTASNASIPTTLYASLINKTGGATDPNTQQASGTNPAGQFEGNNFPCQPTTGDPTKCVVWKADLQLPSLSSVLAENITAQNGIDFGTDVFVDEHYDVTDAEGIKDPPGKTYGSVHSLNEVPSQFQTSNNGPNPSGCTYVSPSPAGGCFKSGRGTLPFEFKCTNVPFNQFQNLQNKPGPPLLSIVETFPPPKSGPKPAPEPITLTATNTKAPYRFNGTDYIFNWSPNGIMGNFTACTFDPTGTVQTFCTTFVVKSSCP